MMLSYRTKTAITTFFVLFVACVSLARADELKRRGMMGIQLGPVSDEVKERLKLDSTHGVIVNGVMPGTAAEEAGLKPNDRIRKVGQDAPTDFQGTLRSIRKYRAGDTIPFTIDREGKELTISLTLRPRPLETSPDHEIIYESAGETGKRVRLLVTKPKQEGKRPAVVFIPGISGQSVEFPAQMQHPFKALVAELTKAGFAVVRVERLGVGDSEGEDFSSFTIADDVESFRGAVGKSKTLGFVDADNVFLLGHSTGTIQAAQVARDAKLKGFIAFAPVFRPWTDTATEMMLRRWGFELLPESEIKTRAEKVKAFVDECFGKKKNPREILEGKPELKEMLEGVVNDDFVFDMHYSHGQQLAAIDAAKAWQAVPCPVLVILGTSDFIAGKADSGMVVEAVNRSQPGRATLVEFKELDHMMSKAADQEESFLSEGGVTLHADFTNTIVKWMVARN